MKWLRYYKFLFVLITAIVISSFSAQAQTASAPVRVAVAGITHGHVPWILGRKDKGDLTLVGIYEKDTALARKYAATYKLNPQLFYTDLAKMLEAVKPEAVVAFGSTYEHLAVVQACAPRGIHVMVEKPLATTVAQAKAMQALAQQHGIHLLTNYETSWYPTTEKTYQLVRDSNYVGKVQKVVFHHGHSGPKAIRVNPEFFQWLTDPVQNGGGALMDFGCYGANIMTYLLQGEAPISVTAVTRNFQPAVYPKVDDEATIIVNYPSAQCIIQASWNWPYNRKDMEVYGDKAAITALDAAAMRLRNGNTEQSVKVNAEEVGVYTDPFDYLVKVVKGKEKVLPYSLYSLDNNVQVVRILEAARQSAATGKTVLLNK